MRSDARSLEQAVAELIERRDHKVLLSYQRTLIDRMIADLEAEISHRHERRAQPPVIRQAS
jgi:hypothetical protein